MTDITLETIDSKLDNISDHFDGETVVIYSKLVSMDEKLDTIIGILNAHTTAINNILQIVNGMTPPSTDDEPADEVISSFKAELQAKIDEGLPYDQVKQWIIETLTDLGIYSEDDMNIKIFVHKTGDLILEFKVRPFSHWGECIQFFQDSMGDADYFETSRYTLKNISWWRLNKNQQMEDQHSTTDIVDEVNEQWGDKDDIDFGK